MSRRWGPESQVKMQGLCSWAFSRCSWVGWIPAFLRVFGSWGCLITCKNAGIVAFAVLAAFSVVLRAVGGPLGPLFPLLGGLPGALGGFQGAPGGLFRALLGLFGAIWTSQAVTPSFFGALSRVQEALGGILGPLLGLLGVILTFGTEPPSSNHMITRY